MTRKTKEEKKMAEYRRRLKLLKPSLPQEKKIDSGPNKIEKTFFKPKTGQNITDSSQERKQRLYFHKDLKKSMLFILLVITLEIIIYFATIKI